MDLWVQGKWNNRSQLVLFKHTPQLYLELSLSDRPITVSSSKLERIINSIGKQKGTYHNLGIETAKQLPNAIANPLNILESSTVKDSIVVVTELSDNDGNSHFAKSIKNKVNMLNEEQKAKILSNDDVKYFDKVTNKESLEKAFKKINEGGSSEILRCVKQNSKNVNTIDIAED